MPICFKPYSPSSIINGHMRMGGTNPAGDSISLNSQYLLWNGRPFLPVMGEYHFSRDACQTWPRELAKIKAGGVRIVSTYVLWIYHEETEGHFDFSGDLNLRAFVLECARQGLEVMLRIGPWAHGECRNGGFPDWLQHSGLPLRINDTRYMRKIRTWYQKIYEQVEGLFFSDGGPIIGVQLENELVDQSEHLLSLKQMALDIGFHAPLYTATGWNSKYGAKIPQDEMLPVFAAYADAPWDESLSALPPSPHFCFDPTRNDAAVGMELMQTEQESGWRLPYERYPFASCELGCGLQVTHHRRPIVSAMDAYALSLVKLGCGNNLIGYYMYHGGTNKIGRLSTWQESRKSGYPNDVPILSYDFQTCLSQYGEAREQYGLLNMLHLFVQDFGSLLAPMEHVAAKEFVPCTDTTRLRCCLRTNGKSGFVFVNHHQRNMPLKNVYGAQIEALGIHFPPINVVGQTCFFFPVNMPLSGALLRYATAQPLCQQGNTLFFASIDGITPQYEVLLPDGSTQLLSATPGIHSAFTVGNTRILTLTFEQARLTRRLNGTLYIGENVNLYALNNVLYAIEDGSFSYMKYTNEHFEHFAIQRCFSPAALTLTPVDEPFSPPYLDELHLGGASPLRWMKMEVTTAEGFVTISGKYDVAQIYADQALIADNFYTGIDWRIPARMLFGHECYLVLSEPAASVYLER